jgi:glutathione synthase/RimK-type ligase-like ATP-grasp enzyme
MILIISSPDDVHATAVLKILEKKSADSRILNLSEFPMSMDIGLSFATGTDGQLALRLKDETRIDWSSVSAVWWRRPQSYGFPPTLVDPVNRAFAQQESEFAFKGMYLAAGTYWVNDITRDLQASHKVWQLQVAARLGLDIPRTLITNAPEDVRRFKTETKGDVIYKAFLASPMAWRETRILRDEDMAQIDAVRLAPVIFQSYVPSVRDLRVTVVGRTIFPAGADITSAEYATDVRMNPGIGWTKADLPKDVATRILKMMDHFGLEYGAFDFRVTPEGRHVFLEVNPAGQFLFIQNATGMPIAEALAERLIAGKPA